MGNPISSTFKSITKNGRYSVGCTGQTAVLFRDEEEIARFKDLKYAYRAVISPKSDLFVLKSTTGLLALYGTEPPRLIKKIRFSEIDGAQDEGCCFSPDGELFYNIECHKDSIFTALSVYRAKELLLVKRLFDDDERLCLCDIAFDSKKSDYVMLGFYRNNYGEDYRGSPDNEYLLMRFSGTEITNRETITSEEFDEFIRNGLFGKLTSTR